MPVIVLWFCLLITQITQNNFGVNGHEQLRVEHLGCHLVITVITTCSKAPCVSRSKSLLKYEIIWIYDKSRFVLVVKCHVVRLSKNLN